MKEEKEEQQGAVGTEEGRIKEAAWRWEKQEPGREWRYQSELKGTEEQEETFVFLIYETVFYICC